ncbi:Serine/threonine-protein kinase AfsK [Posidoniimonas corsicana]|uniref:Serine/threonine-protein kinase AfsK n=1 Tax=Posidoniimonas corsicana TaxID=1938618 RepID=A0A5C5VF75_9BACT|nr:PQQ-binding-like beta-propeller repeat protein [Posidoniimonas corsicana]TWT37308.1 Serine/threonine-protein kinase AfsK [Posidoniimonas corsicana]
MALLLTLITRPALRAACVAAALVATTGVAAAGDLVTNSQARRHGLTRQWFSQARVDPARSRIESAVLEGDRLFVLTSAGALQSFDANTGEVMWTAVVGNPGYPSMGPVASPTHIAVVNGGEVYVLDRTTGEVVLRRSTSSGIAAAPAISSGYVYVPQFSGRVDAFPITEKAVMPWHFTSAGRIFEDAVSSPKSIVWSTDRGYLYVADPDAGSVRFRFESTQPIVAPATTYQGSIYAASLDGYVYSLNEQNGAQAWRYACGSPVTESPVAVDDSVMVVSDEPALHCLDAKTGEVRWVARGVDRFVSASPERVYALDRIGNMVVLDRAHGTVRSRAPIAGEYHAVLNEQTDRLYIFTDNGLLQCLHEVGLEEPKLHAPKVDAAAPAPGEAVEEPISAQDAVEQPMEEEPEPEDDPTGNDPFLGGGADDPFGGGAPDPFGAGGSDDPFGGAGGSDDPFGGGGGDDPF